MANLVRLYCDVVGWKPQLLIRLLDLMITPPPLSLPCRADTDKDPLKLNPILLLPIEDPFKRPQWGR